MTWVDKMCPLCWHDNDLHEFGSSQRTPRKVGDKYHCVDCAECEKEPLDA